MVNISPSEATGWILRRIRAGADDDLLEQSWKELKRALVEFGLPTERHIEIQIALEERRRILGRDTSPLEERTQSIEVAIA